jgi:ankyrin repeat protein
MKIHLFPAIALVAAVGAGMGAGASNVADLAEQGNAAGVLALVKNGADINQPQADGATALHWAAHHNDMGLAKHLLSSGATPNVLNDYGVTPLFLAAVNGSADMLDSLLAAGADANATRPSGETVLMTAARSGNIGTVSRLLKSGAAANAVQLSKGQSALHWAVADGHVDIARTLIEAGADIKLRSAGLYTPLMGAARHGSVAMATLLLEKGDDPEAAAKDGSTPLLIATVKGHTELATYLLERGVSPDSGLKASPGSGVKAAGFSPLMWAVGTFEQIPMTYKGLDSEGEWNTFAGIPYRAAKLALVNLLIEKGADVNAKGTRPMPQMAPHNGEGARPPHMGAPAYVIAAQSADAEMMRLLKSKGADPLLTAKDGQTALMAASEGILENTMLLTEDHRLEAAQTALDHGVPLEAEERRGYRAMHVAARAGYHDLITFLLAKGAEMNPVSQPFKGFGLSRYFVEGQSPLGLVEGTLSGIFYERPDTADFLRKLGAVSIGKFSPHDYDKNSPEATDEKFESIKKK